MPVALNDLRGRRLGLEPKLLARDAFDLRIDRRVVPDRAGELSDPDARKRSREPLTVALELERPHGELEAERRRFGVNAVRTADRPDCKPCQSPSREMPMGLTTPIPVMATRRFSADST